jgi:predicted RNase H-like HicB family nuclease
VKVKEVIKLLQNDGWYLARTKGSPSSIQAREQAGSGDSIGKRKCRRATRDFEQYLETGPIKTEMGQQMRYAVVVEKGETSFGAHVPDLPGCVAVADTKQELLGLIQEAIEFHLEGLREDGQPIPPPSSSIEYVEVRAA